MAELLEFFAVDFGCPLLSQPCSEQGTAGGVIEMAEGLAIQPFWMGQALQCQFAEPALGGSQLSDAFAEARNPLFTARMQFVQHRHHLMADPVAFEGLIGIAGIHPDRQLQRCADVCCVCACELQQRSSQARAIRRSIVEGPNIPEGAEPMDVAAASQVHQHSFCAIACGVGGDHITAPAFGGVSKFAVAPGSSAGFAVGLPWFGPADLELHPLGSAPDGQFRGDDA